MSSTMRFDTWRDSNGVLVASGAGGKFRATGSVLQVVSTTKTDAFTMSSQTFSDITGLSVTITPTSASSKILVMMHTSVNQNSNSTGAQLRLMRDSTAISIGDTAGNRTRASIGRINAPAEISAVPIAINFLDSPNSTSALVYKVQIRADFAAATVSVNRNNSDPDDANQGARGTSSITVMEIAG